MRTDFFLFGITNRYSISKKILKKIRDLKKPFTNLMIKLLFYIFVGMLNILFGKNGFFSTTLSFVKSPRCEK